MRRVAFGAEAQHRMTFLSVSSECAWMKYQSPDRRCAHSHCSLTFLVLDDVGNRLVDSGA